MATGLLLFFLGLPTGCKPKEDPTEARRAQIVSNTLHKAGSASPAQGGRRPLIISEPAPDQRQWALQALLRGYESTGRTNALWDDKVRRAFDAFTLYTRVGTTNWPALQKELAAAVATGCDDPMIQYMRVRYSEETASNEKFAAEFLQAHEAMQKSQHHPIFKFFAGIRTAGSLRTANKNSPRGDIVAVFMADLVDLVRDTNAPVKEIFQSVGMLFEHSTDKRWIASVMTMLQPELESRHGQTEEWLVLLGRVEIDRAWGDRGGSYAYKVTDEGWKGFSEHLHKAEAALNKAWELNPTNAFTAYQMMRLELGQGRSMSRMRTWFLRAMTLATNYYDAAWLMAYYLEPRWHGSEEQALAFGRSCVASKEWGGRVPLVLHYLHESLAKYNQLSNSPAYWQRPQVWPDVKSSFDKFFVLNPDDHSYRHDYARAAYYCGQYPVFLEQAKLFSTGTNHTFFGGPEKFQEMVAKASTASAKPPP